VKLGDAELSASDFGPSLDFADVLVARAGAFFFARLVVFLDFFAAISSSKTSDAMTAQASSQDEGVIRGQSPILLLPQVWASCFQTSQYQI